MRAFCLLLPILLAACQSRPPNDAALRDQAALRGLEVLRQIARSQQHFSDYGPDLMWAFYTLSEASADPLFKQQARAHGRAAARRWRDTHRTLPPNLSAIGIYNWASGSSVADDLGLIDDPIRHALATAAKRFPPEDYLDFNPAREGPPSDIPASCERCRKSNPRGEKFCRRCGQRLEMKSPLDVLYYALVATYSGHHYGIWMGGEFADVVQWLPSVRPYVPPSDANDTAVPYAVTHIVYTFNDYSLFRLRPEWLPAEFEYIRSNAQSAIRNHDPELLGEYIDSLQAFGVPDSDPLVRSGINYLLARQNPDGSWGDPAEQDVYTRYHTTWTGIGGVMRYAWRGERVTVPEALRRLKIK